jgi:hypothetical protein
LKEHSNTHHTKDLKNPVETEKPGWVFRKTRMGEIPLCARNTQDVLRKDTEHTKEFEKTRMGFSKNPDGEMKKPNVEIKLTRLGEMVPS